MYIFKYICQCRARHLSRTTTPLVRSWSTMWVSSRPWIIAGTVDRCLWCPKLQHPHPAAIRSDGWTLFLVCWNGTLYLGRYTKLINLFPIIGAVPLMMAYVTRFIYGTDKLRSNAFEVRGLNGASTGIINCDDLAILSQWLKLITDNIFGLTHLQVGFRIAIIDQYKFVSQ